MKDEQMHEFQTYTGCAGFYERLWKGFFYPEDLPTKQYLDYYAKHLNAVEINSTFYRRPSQKTLLNWYHTTQEAFKFFIKMPKSITHLYKLKDMREQTFAFCNDMHAGLQEKLAGFLFQLPPSYQFNEHNLDKLLTTVDRHHTNVVEFRHNSWWQDEIKQRLREANIVMAGVSIPKDISDEVVINNDDVLYYRLHGVPDMFASEYSEDELRRLYDQIRNYGGRKFIFFNNTFGIAGIKNALFMQGLINN